MVRRRTSKNPRTKIISIFQPIINLLLKVFIIRFLQLKKNLKAVAMEEKFNMFHLSLLRRNPAYIKSCTLNNVIK